MSCAEVLRALVTLERYNSEETPLANYLYYTTSNEERPTRRADQ